MFTNHVRAVALWLFAILVVRGAWGLRTASFDFDEIMMIAMGFAGLAYVIVDLKRERRLDQFAIAICEDIATLKAVLGEGNPHPLNERVAAIEASLETFDPADVRERLAKLEVRSQADESEDE